MRNKEADNYSEALTNLFMILYPDLPEVDLLLAFAESCDDSGKLNPTALLAIMTRFGILCDSKTLDAVLDKILVLGSRIAAGYSPLNEILKLSLVLERNPLVTGLEPEMGDNNPLPFSPPLSPHISPSIVESASNSQCPASNSPQKFNPNIPGNPWSARNRFAMEKLIEGRDLVVNPDLFDIYGRPLKRVLRGPGRYSGRYIGRVKGT